jgi:hypothetical protein
MPALAKVLSKPGIQELEVAVSERDLLLIAGLQGDVGVRPVLLDQGVAPVVAAAADEAVRPIAADQTLIPCQHEDVIDAMQRRMDLAPYAMRARRRIVEHPFGTIKSWMGNPHLLMRRLKNVKTEIGLHVLAYNLTRVMQILGARPLIAAIQT